MQHLRCLEAVNVQVICLKVGEQQQAEIAAAGGQITTCATYPQVTLAAGLGRESCLRNSRSLHEG